jgi:hypothetical protein
MCTFAAITAIVLYQFILQPRHKNEITKIINHNNNHDNKAHDKLKNDNNYNHNNNNKHQNNNGGSHSPKPTTFFIQLRDIVLVYGIILPIWVILPSLVLYYLDLRNFLFKFVIGVVSPTLCLFRTTEGTPTKQTKHRYTDALLLLVLPAANSFMVSPEYYYYCCCYYSDLEKKGNFLLFYYQIVYHYTTILTFSFFLSCSSWFVCRHPIVSSFFHNIYNHPTFTTPQKKPCMGFVPLMSPNRYRTMCYTLPLPCCWNVTTTNNSFLLRDSML